MVANRRQNTTSSRVTGDKKKAGLIRKYGLNMSRQAFREKAEDIGFKKVSSYSPYLPSVQPGSCPSSAMIRCVYVCVVGGGDDDVDFAACVFACWQYR